VTYELTRLVVGVQVLFTGISLPKAYLRKEALSLGVLLVGVMTVAWFVSALLIWGLIPNLTYLESLTIAAAITPTDPVLANSITKGRFAERNVPTNLRNIIVAESGANDGLGFPFLFLGIYLLARSGGDAGTSIGTEVGRWVYGVVLYRIVLSVIYGAIVGVLAHKTLKWAETRGYIDRDNFFAYGFGLALFTLGTTGLFNSDDIFGCFIAGNAFTWKDWYRVRTQVEEEDSFQDILDSLLNVAVFIYIGAIIPWSEYNTGSSYLGIAPWRIVLLGICIIVLRRLPWVVAMWKAIPAITSFSEALFAGWFGPIGVGAVFYIQVALREIPDDGTRDRLRAVYTPVVLFCVFSSVLTHGVTIPLAKIGPGIVRRTTSFSAQKTLSFTAKPSRNSGSPTSSSVEDDVSNGGAGSATNPPVAKEVWNPLWSLAWGQECGPRLEERLVLEKGNQAPEEAESATEW
jgi:NhaP-type Na+/H+ or K+/H+ antiporter